MQKWKFAKKKLQEEKDPDENDSKHFFEILSPGPFLQIVCVYWEPLTCSHVCCGAQNLTGERRKRILAYRYSTS